MDTPKTELCCGQKPKRTFYQTGFSDDEGYFVLDCRKKCGNKMSVENMSRGTSQVENTAVNNWNALIKTF